MKKICIITVLIIIAASAAADEVKEALSDITSDEVIQSTRELIQSGIQTNSVIVVTRNMVQNGFKNQQIKNAQQILLDAHQQGLPPDPIINKAFEGMSKHVQADRIISAMEKVQARYAFAHQQAVKLTGQKTQINQMGHIMASGLAAGLNEKDIETMMQGLQESSRGMNADQRNALAIETFKLARDMSRLGVSPSQTVSVISQALHHQFNAMQMQNMRFSFKHDSRVTSPQSAAASYGKAIQQGKSFIDPGRGQMGESGSSGSAGEPGSGGPGNSGGTGGSGSGSGGSGSGGSGSPGGSGGDGGSGGSGPGGGDGSGGHR
jgi:hypothetical protein